MTTVRDLRTQIVNLLTARGIPEPEVDTDLLIGFVLKASRGRVQAMAMTDAFLAPEDEAAILQLVGRRAEREPLQHITGQAPFRSLLLAVGPGVFVPRPETEQVVQFAIDALQSVPSAAPIAVDLGTGSGAIALAMATEVPHAVVYGVENSAEAFAWTERNFRDCAGAAGAEGAEGANAHPVFADLATALPELDGKVDVVVSNPPYIPSDAIPRDPEVRLFDPDAALYGGADGLDVVRVVSKTARRLLRAGGTLVIEHGELQGQAIRELLADDGWRAPSTHRDWTARDRTTLALR